MSNKKQKFHILFKVLQNKNSYLILEKANNNQYIIKIFDDFGNIILSNYILSTKEIKQFNTIFQKSAKHNFTKYVYKCLINALEVL